VSWSFFYTWNLAGA